MVKLASVYFMAILSLMLTVVAVAQHMWIKGHNGRLDQVEAKAEAAERNAIKFKRDVAAAENELNLLRQEILDARSARKEAELAQKSASARVVEARRIETETASKLQELEGRYKAEAEAHAAMEKAFAEAQSGLAEAKRQADEAKLDAEMSSKELLALKQELVRLRGVAQSAPQKPVTGTPVPQPAGTSEAAKPPMTTGTVNTQTAQPASSSAAEPAPPKAKEAAKTESKPAAKKAARAIPRKKSGPVQAGAGATNPPAFSF